MNVVVFLSEPLDKKFSPIAMCQDFLLVLHQVIMLTVKCHRFNILLNIMIY